MGDDRPANWNPWNPWTWVPMPGDEPLGDTAWPPDPRWPQSRGIYMNPGDRRYRGTFGGTAPGGPPQPGADTGAMSKNEVMQGNQSVMPYGGYGRDQVIYPERAQQYNQTTIDMQRLLGALDPMVRVEGGPQEYGVNAPAHQPLPQIFDAVPWAGPQKESSTPVTPQELMSLLGADDLSPDTTLGELLGGKNGSSQGSQ